MAKKIKKAHPFRRGDLVMPRARAFSGGQVSHKAFDNRASSYFMTSRKFYFDAAFNMTPGVVIYINKRIMKVVWAGQTAAARYLNSDHYFVLKSRMSNE